MEEQNVGRRIDSKENRHPLSGLKQAMTDKGRNVESMKQKRRKEKVRPSRKVFMNE